MLSIRKILLIISPIIFGGCTFLNDKPKDQKREPSFYERKAIVGKGISIPLIKPYSAMEDENIRVWKIELLNMTPFKHNKALHSMIAIFDSLNVIDSAIIAKCTNGFCTYGGETSNEVYYIIIPSFRVELAFFSYHDFLEYWNKVSARPPVFYSAYDLYEKWRAQDTLIWGTIDSSYERKAD